MSAQLIQEMYVDILFGRNLEASKTPALSRPGEDYARDALSSIGFSAEIRGRRNLIAKELQKRFKGFLSLNGFANLQEICDSTWLGTFLRSDYFLTNKYSCLSYLGLGPGYESISKFFFFCQNDRYCFSHKMSLYQEFSIFLMDEYNLREQ